MLRFKKEVIDAKNVKIKGKTTEGKSRKKR
jgi:hypothetical protein